MGQSTKWGKVNHANGEDVDGHTQCKKDVKTFYRLSLTIEVKSHSTGEVIKLHVSATCKSSDLRVYVIACKRCGKQYVGETEQALHERMNSHRSDIRKKTKEKPWRLTFAQTATPSVISVWLWLINFIRGTRCFERTGSRSGFDSCKRRRPKALTSGLTDFELPQPWLLLAISEC